MSLSLAGISSTIGAVFSAAKHVSEKISKGEDVDKAEVDRYVKAGEYLGSKKADKYNLSNVDISFGFGKERSLTAVLSKYIIEPTIFISKDVAASCPDIKDKAICECIDLFTTLFSQCFHSMVNVEGQDSNIVVNLMGTSNKNYNASDVAFSAVSSVAQGVGSNFDIDGRVIDGGLRVLKNAYDKVGMESMDIALCDLKNRRFLTIEPGIEAAKDKTAGVELPKEQISMGFHIRNFEVTINKTQAGSNQSVLIKIPFIVRANIVELNVDHMCHGMKSKTNDKTFWRRWHKWRSGAISFWRDLVFCSDLIEQNKKDRLADKSGMGRKIDNAKYNARLSGKDIDEATMERFYNMLIVTPSDLNKIYQIDRGDIHNLAYKERLFKNLNALMLLSLDPEWEMGELFLKDLKGVSTIKFDNIGKRKGNGMDGDLNTLFRSLYASNAPAF